MFLWCASSSFHLPKRRHWSLCCMAAQYRLFSVMLSQCNRSHQTRVGSQEIGWEERFQNDLFYVEWGVKPCSISVTQCTVWPVVTDISWSVCVSVDHNCEPYWNGWTSRDATWCVDSSGSNECIGLGWIPPQEGAVLRVLLEHAQGYIFNLIHKWPVAMWSLVTYTKATFLSQ